MNKLHGTTIICVRMDKEVAIGGDGQVSQGDTVLKNNAVKLSSNSNVNVQKKSMKYLKKKEQKI